MADARKRKVYGTAESDAAALERARAREAARRRIELQEALNKWLAQQRDAWVTSVPGAKYLRIECRQGSTVPAKLAELGFYPTHCGTGTRIAPNATTETFNEAPGRPVVRSHGGIVDVDIIEIELGK